MKASESVDVFETPTSTYWFENGLMHVITKKGTPPDFEAHKKEIRLFKERSGNKQVYAIIEVNNSTPYSKQIRDYNAAELPNLFKAVAFIIKKPLMKMLATLYLGVAKTPFPVKMCSNEQEAMQWIKQKLG